MSEYEPGAEPDLDDDQTVAEEVRRGRSWRTPFVAIGGVAVAIGVLFAVALAIVVLAYVLA